MGQIGPIAIYWTIHLINIQHNVVFPFTSSICKCMEIVLLCVPCKLNRLKISYGGSFGQSCSGKPDESIQSKQKGDVCNDHQLYQPEGWGR